MKHADAPQAYHINRQFGARRPPLQQIFEISPLIHLNDAYFPLDETARDL